MSDKFWGPDTGDDDEQASAAPAEETSWSWGSRSGATESAAPPAPVNPPATSPPRPPTDDDHYWGHLPPPPQELAAPLTGTVAVSTLAGPAAANVLAEPASRSWIATVGFVVSMTWPLLLVYELLSTRPHPLTSSAFLMTGLVEAVAFAIALVARRHIALSNGTRGGVWLVRLTMLNALTIIILCVAASVTLENSTASTPNPDRMKYVMVGVAVYTLVMLGFESRLRKARVEAHDLPGFLLWSRRFNARGGFFSLRVLAQLVGSFVLVVFALFGGFHNPFSSHTATTVVLPPVFANLGEPIYTGNSFPGIATVTVLSMTYPYQPATSPTTTAVDFVVRVCAGASRAQDSVAQFGLFPEFNATTPVFTPFATASSLAKKPVLSFPLLAPHHCAEGHIAAPIFVNSDQTGAYHGPAPYDLEYANQYHWRL